MLRQNLYSCKTCASHTPSTSPSFGSRKSNGAAALCYSCSISCHGDHELVELFEKRGFRCDCGTLRVPGVECKIRKECDAKVEEDSDYGQNFWGRFCTCEGMYDACKEEGVMHQCLLGDVCQEDWFHDTCLVGRDAPKYIMKQKGTPVAADEKKATAPAAKKESGSGARDDDGQQDDDEEEEDDEAKRAKELGYPLEFGNLICWKCLDANPGLKQLASYPDFFVLEWKGAVSEEGEPARAAVGASPPKPEANQAESRQSQKRKASDLQEEGSDGETVKKRAREQDPKENETPGRSSTVSCTLPAPSPRPAVFSLLLSTNFRETLCRCPSCFQNIRAFRMLLEEEDAHEPQISRSASPTGSILEEGERALNSMNRVRAIEGVLAYNQLKDTVKAFLEPFAKSGKVVGAEDVVACFEELKEKERKKLEPKL